LVFHYPWLPIAVLLASAALDQQMSATGNQLEGVDSARMGHRFHPLSEQSQLFLGRRRLIEETGATGPHLFQEFRYAMRDASRVA
jgi:hypothetical protein